MATQELRCGACSVTVQGHIAAMQTRDGGWVVQVPESGAAVVGYSGGAMLNVAGSNDRDIHVNQPALPIRVSPRDAMVTAIAGNGRGTYWDVPGRSTCTQAMPVVFVSYALEPDLLRPPALGDNWIARFLRSEPIHESSVNLDKLPQVVDPAKLGVNYSAWGAGMPNIPYLLGLLAPFAGDCYGNWSTDTRTPDQQHPGYGSAYASVVSQALVQLCGVTPKVYKRDLALAMVQRGLDLAGAFADGRRNYPLGGHMAGRKALVILAGHLLGVPQIADPTAIVGPVFQEDLAYIAGRWWFGGHWSSVWRYRLEPIGATVEQPPATWGDPMAPQHNSLAWMVAGYLPQVVGAQIGTSLAMRLMGLTANWSARADLMVEQWMEGPPPSADRQLRDAGLSLPWGTDYALVRGASFCAAAWRRNATR